MASEYSYGVALARLMQRVELEERKTVYGAEQVLGQHTRGTTKNLRESLGLTVEL